MKWLLKISTTTRIRWGSFPSSRMRTIFTHSVTRTRNPCERIPRKSETRKISINLSECNRSSRISFLIRDILDFIRGHSNENSSTRSEQSHKESTRSSNRSFVQATNSETRERRSGRSRLDKVHDSALQGPERRAAAAVKGASSGNMK